MNYENIKNLIKEQNIAYLEIKDTNGKRLCYFEAPSPDSLIQKIEMHLPFLMTFGRVNFIAATESQKKQNWKECFTWPVVFSATTTPTPQQNVVSGIGAPAPGYVSLREAELMAKVEKMELEGRLNAKMAELEKKISKKDEGDAWERRLDKYAPMIMPALGFKMDENSIKQAALWYQMNGMGTQQPTGMAGLSTGVHSQTGAKIELTEEEKQQLYKINTGIDKLSEKIPADKIVMLIEGLNANPGMADMAIGFMNQNKNS